MASQHEELTVQAGPVAAQVAKAGQGDPLVYLHGAFGYQGWPPLLDRLAERFTVYAPLHPGFGDSDGIENIDNILDLALYHFDLLDALGLEAPHMVGHFLGAMMAAEMAALCSHRVNKLVLAAPAGIWLDHDPGVDYFAIPANELRSVLFNDPDSDIANITLAEPDSDEERGRQQIDRLRSLSATGKFLWPIPDKGLKKRLHRIKSPTLIVLAESDRIVPPSHGDEVAGRIQGSRLHVVKEAGHLFNLERPDELADLVVEFLSP